MGKNLSESAIALGLDASEVAGPISDVFAVAKRVLMATQETRFRWFLRGCKKSLQDAGELDAESELKLVELFKNDFAKKHAHDFIRRVIDSNSGVAQCALARLYIRCATRSTPHATRNELILLKAYEGLDDHDIEILFRSFYVATGAEPDMVNPIPPNAMNESGLKISKDLFHAKRVNFENLGIDDHDELVTVIESFAQRQVFSSMLGSMTSMDGDLAMIKFNSRSAIFLGDLAWARIANAAI